MIYWFIGQAGVGKTTLSKKFKSFNEKTNHTVYFDGDDLRKMFKNSYEPSTFTKEYRIEQTRCLQNLVKYIHGQGFDIIISTVSPYRDVREQFKTEMGDDIVEIYIHKLKSIREHFAVVDYEVPLENFIDIDTTDMTEEMSFSELLNELNSLDIIE